jgi:DNA-3-methyladenine glycosylase II
MQERGCAQPLISLPTAETHLTSRDPKLAGLILDQPQRWPSEPTEDPIFGLVRIIIAQQISTAAACRTAQRIRALYPSLVEASKPLIPDLQKLRSFGIPESRAQCCITITERSQEILTKVAQGGTWEQELAGIKGIGPWTIAVFRIMVLRDPDVLPLGDVGLERAIRNVYGRRRNVQRLGETWRPFRSVACWYLWRTLGNQQLG